MEPYVERMLEEEAELAAKLAKLDAFMTGDIYAGMIGEPRRLMINQRCHMAAYLDCLKKRIALAR